MKKESRQQTRDPATGQFVMEDELDDALPQKDVEQRAVGYVRISRDELDGSGKSKKVSPEAQRQKITDYCRLYDLNLIGIVGGEKAVSASRSLEDRACGRKLLGILRRGEANAVVVWALDRMFRDTVETLEVVEWFESEGITFHSTTERIDTGSAYGRFFLTILAGLGEMERSRTSERMKLVTEHKLKKLEYLGGSAPYGWEADPALKDPKTGSVIELAEGQKRMLVPVPEEIEILQFMKHAHDQGHGWASICRLLRDKGFRTRSGNLDWDRKTVRAVVLGMNGKKGSRSHESLLPRIEYNTATHMATG